jgi:hypothetical protein
MISLNWRGMNGEIGALMSRFNELPRHIAKKHCQAAVKRAMKDGVPVLKSLTPKGKPKTVKSAIVKGQIKENFKRRGGALRRSVTTKAKYIGRNKDGFVYGVVGYKAGMESRKAIWLEFGTSTGIKPRKIIDQFRARYGGPAASRLAAELAAALPKAAAELAAGKNPTRTYGRS